MVFKFLSCVRISVAFFYRLMATAILLSGVTLVSGDISIVTHMENDSSKDEAQHFQDYKKFPDLVQYELEYRAKLAEIYSAEKTIIDILTRFNSSMSEDKNQPHAFANRRVMLNLRAALDKTQQSDNSWWQGIPHSLIREAAKKLLDEDTNSRNCEPNQTIK